MRRSRAILAFLALISLAAILGCGGSGSTVQSQQAATVFVTGSDAPPIAAVLAFQITLDKITLSDGTSSAVVLNTPSTYEFSRFLGLRTLLALDSVNPGTYTQATIQLENPVITYLDTSTTPATIKVMAPPATSLTQSQVTVALNPFLQVAANGLAGLHMHFNLRNSILVDANNQITGQVTPDIIFRALQLPDDADAEIDELRGTVMSVGASSFVLQRVNGRQFTIDVTNSTEWSGIASSLTNLTVGSIAEVSGKVQADGSILADDVEVLTTDKEFIAGIVLGTNPSSGAASSVTLLVRDQIPVVSGISVGQTATAAIDNNTVFAIRNFNLPITSMLFNSSSLVLGQSVGIGGVMDNTTMPPTLDARRIVLRRQGFDGQAVSGTINVVSGNQGSFELQNDGFWGYLFGGPLQVVTSNLTNFVNVSGLSAITPSMQLRVVGLLLRDSSGNPVLVAWRVEQGMD